MTNDTLFDAVDPSEHGPCYDDHAHEYDPNVDESQADYSVEETNKKVVGDEEFELEEEEL